MWVLAACDTILTRSGPRGAAVQRDLNTVPHPLGRRRVAAPREGHSVLSAHWPRRRHILPDMSFHWVAKLFAATWSYMTSLPLIPVDFLAGLKILPFLYPQVHAVTEKVWKPWQRWTWCQDKNCDDVLSWQAHPPLVGIQTRNSTI